jgi:hypothetical protein
MREKKHQQSIEKYTNAQVLSSWSPTPMALFSSLYCPVLFEVAQSAVALYSHNTRTNIKK